MKQIASKALLAACIMLISFLAYCSALKMEATYSFKMFVDFQWTAQWCIPKAELFEAHNLLKMIIIEILDIIALVIKIHKCVRTV
jgi:hypothetical protein